MLSIERQSFKGRGSFVTQLSNNDLNNVSKALFSSLSAVSRSGEAREALGLQDSRAFLPRLVEIEIVVATKNRYRVEKLSTFGHWDDEKVLGLISNDNLAKILFNSGENMDRIRKWFWGAHFKLKRPERIDLKRMVSGGFVFDQLKLVKLFFNSSCNGKKVCAYCEWKIKIPFELMSQEYTYRQPTAIGKVLEMRVDHFGEIETDVILRK